MTSLKSLAISLENMAQQVHTLRSQFLLPMQTITLADATTQIKAVHDKTCSISMRLHIPSGSPPSIAWDIWDGTNIHEGKTLLEALNVFLAHKASEDTDHLKEAEETIAAI